MIFYFFNSVECDSDIHEIDEQRPLLYNLHFYANLNCRNKNASGLKAYNSTIQASLFINKISFPASNYK